MTDITASLLLAAIGSAITFLVQHLRVRVRDRRLRRQYPAEGLFTTEFEDKQDGERVIEKGLTRLAQRGLEISGVTSELQSGRCWLLQGRIAPGGFVTGVYTAEDPHDTGSGTFFLEIDGASGDMNGLWAGYDSVNHSIEGGRYSFRRAPDASIREAKPEESGRVVGLLGDALGDRYVELNYEEQLTSANGSERCFVANAESGHLAGAATVSKVSSAGLQDCFPIGHESLVHQLPVGQYHDSVGLIRAIAVSPSYRQRGVATQLTRAAMDWLIDSGATLAMSFGWKSPEGCHVAGVLESCGFTAIREVDGFWTEDSKSDGYSCPSCGDVCECTAVIFTRSLLDVPRNRCRI